MDTRNASSIDRYNFEAPLDSVTIVDEKMVMYASLPLFIALVSSIVWSVILKIQ